MSLPSIASARAFPDPAAWDELISVTGAPTLYRSSVLEAHVARPLQPTLDVRYLLARDATGRLVAALPLYLVPARDPLGSVPGLGGRTWAITHFWHCNDTRLPALRPDRALTAAMWEAVRAQAGEWRADRFGFVNVATENELGGELAAAGAEAVPARPRYRIRLEGDDPLDGYLRAVGSSVRQELRRHARRVARSGREVHVLRPPFPPAVIERVCALCGLTAARHNPGYYEPAPLAHLLDRADSTVRVAAISAGADLVAASITFVDPPVLQNWAIGAEPGERRAYSPYLVLLQTTIALALELGCRVVELGRENGDWKQRVGARPVPLTSWMSPVSGGWR